MDATSTASTKTIAPMPEPEIAALADEHADFDPSDADSYCGSCCESWPCSTARFIAAVRPELVERMTASD